MAVAKIYSAAPIGFEGKIIEVEGDATRGLPSIQIVGLANKSIDEAKERVKSALINSGFQYPAKRLTINLAPAQLPKDGTHYDLPIALSILTASGQLQQYETNNCFFAGELALDGSIRPVRAIINLAESAQKAGFNKVFVPKTNASQAQMIPGIKVFAVSNLKELFLHLKNQRKIKPSQQTKAMPIKDADDNGPLLDDIIGQEKAKRALIIAVAGRHNLLLKGPPGTGKTMLAKTILNLLPRPSDKERLAITKMHSLNGESIDSMIDSRPFRAPHYGASRTAIIGGGSIPQPGEISLAHCGVLFLDELPEYPRNTLEALRQPLEDRQVSISRAQHKVTYPADFMLVATANPCPCGYYGDEKQTCSCSTQQIINYQKRLSGPLLDRIDLTLDVPRVPQDKLLQSSVKSKTQHNNALKLIDSALSMQSQRYKSSNKYNSNLTSRQIRTVDFLSPSAQQLLVVATDKLQLSTRAYFRIARLARTIADLEQQPQVGDEHVAEALQYRQP